MSALGKGIFTICLVQNFFFRYEISSLTFHFSNLLKEALKQAFVRGKHFIKKHYKDVLLLQMNM